MVFSVRNTLANSVPFEFIIADNDSNDGTWEWIQAQPDITAIQMGEPVGAIKAFTECGKLATGDYTLIATDDIWFPPHAILKAMRYLEQNPACGVVAFAHNKHGNFQVDRQKAQTLHGEVTNVIYPQICLVRTWLAQRIGWWGGDDPHMKNSFTYGGDNWLGAKIVELGYTVDAVDGCNDLEDTIADTSRQLSSARHLQDHTNYWELYPEGVVIHPNPRVENPQREKLRVLLALHYNPRFPHHKANKKGMETALRELGHVVTYDYAGAKDQGCNVAEEFQRIAEAWQPHVIWTQVHNETHGLPIDAIQRARMVSPKSVCINWNGDYWVENIQRTDTQEMYRLFDLILVQSVYLQEELTALGIHSAYLPHSFEPVTPQTDTPHYDVVFQGNGYTEYRESLIRLLHGLPYTVGLYGRSSVVEMSGETNYQYDLEQGIYRNSTIAVSPMQFDAHTARGFVSNRMWEIMASGGAICLQQHVPMLDELTGLQAGVHYAEWRDFDELRDLIDYYMQHADEAREIAQNAYNTVRQCHGFDSRIQHVLTEIL